MHAIRLSNKIQDNFVLDLVLSSIPAKKFVSIQRYENKFKNGMFFYQKWVFTHQNLRFTIFCEDYGKMSHILPSANTEIS